MSPKPKKGFGLHALAAQTLKIASISGLSDLERLENDLEKRIERDNKEHTTTLGRLRHKGEHFLHSKLILFVAVVLNIVDIMLVTVELILDFYYVSDHLHEKEDLMESFMDNMVQKKSPELDYYKPIKYDQANTMLQEILDGRVFWNSTQIERNVTHLASDCVVMLNTTAADLSLSLDSYAGGLLSTTRSQPPACFQQYLTEDSQSSTANKYRLDTNGIPDDTNTVVAHKLHYISVAILSVLLIIVIAKIFCSGAHFFKSKMQVFDGVVIVISFVLDVVFIKGITEFDVDKMVIILTILLIWRVVRVLNSLIVAVLEEQMLSLKIVYTQKKKASKRLNDNTEKLEVLQGQLNSLKSLCKAHGITALETNQALVANSVYTNHNNKRYRRSASAF